MHEFSIYLYNFIYMYKKNIYIYMCVHINIWKIIYIRMYVYNVEI